MLHQYLYPCDVAPSDQHHGNYLVSFPDLTQATASAPSFREALYLAPECLRHNLAIHVQRNFPIPSPSPLLQGQELVSVQPITAAQLNLHAWMRQHNTSCHRLAPTLGISPTELRALRDLDYSIPLSRVRDLLHQVTADPEYAPHPAAAGRTHATHSGMTVTETRDNRRGLSSILIYHTPPNEHTPTGWTLVHHGGPSTFPTLQEAIDAAEAAMQEHIRVTTDRLTEQEYWRQQRRQAEQQARRQLEALFANSPAQP